jgi:hypothetical protein
MRISRRAYLKNLSSLLGGGILLPYLNTSSRSTVVDTQIPQMNTLIYENDLSRSELIDDFIQEGKAQISFNNGRLRMQNALPLSAGKKAHFVIWCPKDFPNKVKVRWEFKPLVEPGLAMIFFGAQNLDGGSIFDESLPKRDGQYAQYHSGFINTYHLSYFRRKQVSERAFHTCNLRKSKGFHSVTSGADPIPSVIDIKNPYQMELIKYGGHIRFSINDLRILEWIDDGKTLGPILTEGKIGFRQMAPLVAEYANLKVYSV